MKHSGFLFSELYKKTNCGNKWNINENEDVLICFEK